MAYCINGCIIFDFDNTIFPTHWFQQRCKCNIKSISGQSESNLNSKKKFYPYTISNLTKSEQQNLVILSTITSCMLLKYLQAVGPANVFVVSSANKSWIEQTLKICSGITNSHFGFIYKLIFNDNLYTAPKIQLPWKNLTTVINWKFKVFYQLYCKFHYYPSLAVIVIGDGVHEYYAAGALRQLSNYANRTIHRIKMIYHPDLKQLAAQQYYVLYQLSDMSKFGNFKHHLDIELIFNDNNNTQK